MPGKTRPCLRKVLVNVDYSNLSLTDKKCIRTIFEKYDLLQEKNIKLQQEVYEQQAEIERWHNLQKPTETSGFRIENGRVVFYTNMLNGYRHELKDLDAVVRDLNLMLQNSYKNDQIIGLYKNTIENQVSELKSAKAEAIKEFAERLKNTQRRRTCDGYIISYIPFDEIDNLVKEMVGDAE